MSHESILDRPILSASGKIVSWWSNLRHSSGADGSSIREEKKVIIAVQWLIAIGTSYLVFAAHNWTLTEPLSALLILLCLASAPVLQRIPDVYFAKRRIEPGLLVVDSILIVSAIMLPEEVPWDLLALFFFCVLIAAIGESLIQIGLTSVLLSLIFLMFVSSHATEVWVVDSKMLIRVPYMFGISIFYGHLAGQVRREKRRIEKMEETMKLKRQLVCALAHDIKTPLNVILGHAELLAGEYACRTTPAEKLSSIKCIRNNIEGIVKLITEFLAVSKLEMLQANPAKSLVRMNLLATDVVLQQMVTARDKNVRLSLDLDQELKPVLGDDDQLRRALWNLVSNAIKYTPSGGNITVSSRMVNKNICVKVSDTGLGIPEDEISGLFSEFRRLKGSADIEGTGLGLFIVKTIVDSHDGSIEVESKEGSGTTFTLLLPSCKHFPRSSQPDSPVNEMENDISRERTNVRAMNEHAGIV